jgi:hypothetical protein
MAKGLGFSQRYDEKYVDQSPKSNDPVHDVPWDRRYDGPADNAPKTSDYKRDAKRDAESVWKKYPDGNIPQHEFDQWKDRWRRRSGRYGFQSDDDMARADRILDDVLDDGSDNW